MGAGLDERVNLAAPANEQHRDPVRVGSLQLAFREVGVGQHSHEAVGQAVVRRVIDPDLLPEDEVSAEVSRRARYGVAEHGEADPRVPRLSLSYGQGRAV